MAEFRAGFACFVGRPNAGKSTLTNAITGEQVDDLVEVLCRHLPESPQLYPDDMLTDEPEQVLIAELIREAALEGVRDELPHSIAVLVEEMLVEGNLTKIYADMYVE